MFANWINWVGAGMGGASAVSMEQGATAYLMVSLLGPMSWMLAVEICRRTRTPQRERNTPAAGNAGARLALPIARLRKPDAANWWTESRPEQD